MRKYVLLFFAWATISTSLGAFAPEKHLPDDTLLFVTAPDVSKAKELARSSAYGRLWGDPQLKPFRDKFAERFKTQFVEPLERELGVDARDYAPLVRKSITIAITKDGWSGASSAVPGWLVVVDTADHAGRARKALAAARQKGLADGKVRVDSLGGHEFLTFQVATNSTLRTLKRLLPRELAFHEAGRPEARTTSEPFEIKVGLFKELLILSTSTRAAEKLIARLEGGAAPALEEQAAYTACRDTIFREATIYGWVNAKPLFEAYAAEPERTGPTPPAAADVLNKAGLVRGSGLSALTGVGFALRKTERAIVGDALLTAPTAERVGLLRLVTGSAAETAIPAFVPPDAAQFSRWRMEGDAAWDTLQKMMSEISPQWTSTMQFIIDTANQAAQLKDPGFDVRKTLIGNLGNDFIRFSRAPAGDAADNAGLYLLRSPQPGQFAAALQRVLIFLSSAAESPAERDFIGHKIYSVALPSVPLPFEGASTVPAGRTLHYAATRSHVALSTDISLLEEYLREPEPSRPSLGTRPGLKEALADVTDTTTSWLSFEDHSAAVRRDYEVLRSGAGATNALPSLLPDITGLANPEKTFEEWFDFKLLPPFDRVRKHFSYGVRGSGADSRAIRFRWCFPNPAPSP